MEWITANVAAEIIGALYNCKVSVVGKIPCNILEQFEEKSLRCKERDKIINEISRGLHVFSKEAIKVLLKLREEYIMNSDSGVLKVSWNLTKGVL